MAPNSAKYLISNGTDDRVSLFDDGRVKVWSTTHLWTEEGRERHNALGETVLLGIGRTLGEPGPVDRRQQCDAEFELDPEKGHTVAATVGADNGTFVQFFHDGKIAVGNDGRDVATVFNMRPGNDVGSRNDRGRWVGDGHLRWQLPTEDQARE